MNDLLSHLRGDLAALSAEVEQAIAAAGTQDDLTAVKITFLGKKGRLTAILKQLGALPAQERAAIGEEANALKTRLLTTIDGHVERLQAGALEAALVKEAQDITLPGTLPPVGHQHPIATALDEIVSIFVAMGFSVEEGPEIETEHYNFEALNMPATHPARDMQDTFYIKPGVLLRTHTSPVQIRFMETHRPPFQMIAPGKVYRRDSDVSHTPMFHQVEGLVVSETVSMAELKGTLSFFLASFFGQEVTIRLRPSYFPFTEPSCEVDIACILCGQSGCPACKQTGWLEVMGAGMVHPKVFAALGYDAQTLSGFAFGMGVERLAMLKYRIPDIRLFYDNDLRFLAQF